MERTTNARHGPVGLGDLRSVWEQFVLVKWHKQPKTAAGFPRGLQVGQQHRTHSRDALEHGDKEGITRVGGAQAGASFEKEAGTVQIFRTSN